MGRDDFTEPEKTQLAQRAGCICSNPACRVLTIGPEPTGDRSVKIGRAAHICAAAQRGPRYDESMTTEVRRSALQNGIWLCAACADIIDAHDGRNYTAEDLWGWRHQHEAWVRANINQRVDEGPDHETVIAGTHEAVGVGRVTGLDVRRGARIAPGTFVRAEGIGEVTGTRISNIER